VAGTVSDLITWALEKWPFAAAVVFVVGYLYVGMAFGWGPDLVRPVSAQTMQQQIAVAKGEVLATIGSVQGQLKTISDGQAALQKQQTADRIERLEQQLLWWRQQNCKSKGKAQEYAYQKMTDLKDRYRELTGTEWIIPACADIGG
jgi:4-amino-4-deoxy-L-arabinose transferase-like glycosyltransferase